MQVAAVSAESSAQGPGAAIAARSSAVSKQEFLQLLVAQLRNQDPMKPMDNQQFITQLAQLQTLEQVEALAAASQLSLETQTINQSLSLLGRRVEYFTADGDTTRLGTVQRVQVLGGLPTLIVDGREVEPGSVVSISTP